nr:type II secretion system F family protein [Paenibacillus caui]
MFYLSKGRYKKLTGLKMDGLRLQKAAPPMLFMLETLKVVRRFPMVVFKLGRLLRRLHGERIGGELVTLFLAEIFSYMYLLLMAGCLLSLLMEGDPSGIVIGCILSILLPIGLIGDLRGKVRQREQEIIIELPELLNKIMLLVGAGETVQQAFKHCLSHRKDISHPLYQELAKMMAECEGGYSFGQALEGFSRRCGIQEVASFSTAVMLNYRRGGSDFTLALRELSRSLWEKRKSVSRTRGEQASSKLLLPMLLLFIVVLVLVGTPAFMIMSF